MGSMAEAEAEEATLTPKLLLLKPHEHMDSPDRSGMLTPPLHSLAAAVPFRWEEEPGKPRQCTILSNSIINKCLELPPRLLFDPNNNKKGLPSPTTVLDGPYITKSSSSKFKSSSFRIVGRDIPEKKERRFWGWRKKSFIKDKDKEEVVVGVGYPFSPSIEIEGSGCSKQVKLARVKRAGSFSTLSHAVKSHFWATIYEGLKRVVPWKSKKIKRGGL